MAAFGSAENLSVLLRRLHRWLTIPVMRKGTPVELGGAVV
jgi:hypothetical protein